MTTFRYTLGAAVASVALFAAPIVAAEPAYELISDPAELAAWGFDPDGDPIRRLSPVEDARPYEERLAERLAEEARNNAPDVGGRNVRWASVQGNDFKFLNEGTPYGTQGNFVLHLVPGGPNRFADAPIQLRDDRRLQWLDVWTSDTSVDHAVDVAFYRTCHESFFSGAPVVTEIAVVSAGTFSAGNRFQFVGVPDTYVDNGLCTYFVRARFSSFDADQTVVLQKVRLIWAG